MQILSSESNLGTRNLAIRKQQLQTELQITRTVNRIAHVGDRQLGIDAQRNRLKIQEASLEARIAGMQDKEFARQTRSLKAQQDLIRTQTRMSAIAPVQAISPGLNIAAGIDRQRKELQSTRAAITRDEARMRARLAAERAASLRTAGAPGADVAEERASLAARRYDAAARGAAIAARSVKELDIVYRDLARTEELQQRKIQEIAAQTQVLAAEEARLRAELQQLGITYEQLAAREANLTRFTTEQIAQLRVLEAQMLANRGAAMEMAASNEAASLALAETQRQQTLTNAAMARMPLENMQTLARTVSHTGRVMQMFGGVATVSFGLAANAAAKLNTESTLAATQQANNVDIMVRNGSRIQQAITRTMMQSTSSAEDLSASIYDIFSSTNITQLQKGINFMDLMAQGAIAGQTNVQKVTALTIQVLNSFGGTAQQRLEQMFAAVRYGRMTFDQYAESLSQLVPASRAVGQSFDQMNSAFAAASRQLGVSFARAGLARLYELLSRGEIVKGLHDIGVEVQYISGPQRGRMRPLSNIIQEIAKARPELVQGRKDIQQFFKEISQQGGAAAGYRGTVQSARVFQVLVSHADNYMKITTQITENHKQFLHQLEAMNRTSGVSWAKFVNQIKALVLIIGEAAIPALTAMAKPLAAIADYMSRHEDIARTIGYFGAFAAAGVLLLGTLAAIAGSIAALIISFRLMRGEAGVLAGILGMGGGAKSAAVLGETAVAAKAVSGSLGAVNVQMALFMAALTVGLPVLNHFVGTTKLLTIALQALSAAFTVMALRTLAVFTLNALAARLALTGLATAATALAGVSAIEIVIIVTGAVVLEKLIRMLPHWESDFKGFGESIYRFFHQGAAAANTVPDDLQRTALRIRRILDTMFQTGQLRIGTHAGRAQAKENLSKTFPGLSEEEIDIFFRAAIRRARAGQRELSSRPAQLAGAGGGQAVPAQAQQENVLIQARRLEATRRQLDRQDVPNLDLYRKYVDAKKAFDKQWGEAAKKLVEDVGLVSDKQAMAMEMRLQRLQAVAAVAPTGRNLEALRRAQGDIEAELSDRQKTIFGALAENTKRVSDQTAIAMARSADQAKRAFEAAPSAAKWQRWSQLQKQLTANLTEDQKQMASDMISAMNDAMGTGSGNIQAAIQAQLRIKDLQRAAEAAPTNTTKWAVYYRALEKFPRQFTQIAQQVSEQVANATPMISDRQFIQMSLRLEQMKAALDVKPSSAGWAAYYADVRRLDKLTSDQQKSSLSSFVDALNSMISNARSKIQELTNTLTSMYNNILQRNQAAFGALMSGPIVRGLDSRVQQITSAASKQAAAIRSQGQKAAEAIRNNAKQTADAVKESTDVAMGPAAQKFIDELKQQREGMVFAILNAGQAIDPSVTEYLNNLNTNINRLEDAVKGVKGLDPIMGNLVDWGLLPKPGELNKATNAITDGIQDQASRIEDAANARADAIEAAAQARADALQQRIEQKRFSPQEMLRDLKAQTTAFIKWQNDLKRLVKRGAPPELIKQLRDLGPEYANAIHNLAQSSPGLWNQYLATFRKAQKVIRAQTMADLKSELAQFKQHGKMIADAIITGMTSQDVRMKNVLHKMVTDIFPQLAQVARGNVPGVATRAAPRAITRVAPRVAATRAPTRVAATRRVTRRTVPRRTAAVARQQRGTVLRVVSNTVPGRTVAPTRRVTRQVRRAPVRRRAVPTPRQVIQQARPLAALTRGLPKRSVTRRVVPKRRMQAVGPAPRRVTRQVKRAARPPVQRRVRRAVPTRRRQPTVSRPRPAVPPPARGASQTGRGNVTNFNFHYHAPTKGGMGPQEYFNKMYFRNRNKAGC